MSEQTKLGFCLCGNEGYRIKNGLPVCKRCDEIEKKMYGRRQLTSGGMTKFPNPAAYRKFGYDEAADIYGQ